MATLYVRRSWRLSNQKKRTQEDDEYEVIDLTTEECDRAGDGMCQYQLKKMGVDSMANGKAKTSDTMQEGVGIEVDNIEKGMGKDKIDTGKTKERKAEFVMRKQKLVALVEKLNKMKDAKQVVRKGKLDFKKFKEKS
ncbi:hypothetical protein Tco_0562402 [Tanacetum coccineum]